MLVRFNLATKPLETHRLFLVLSGTAGTVAVLAFVLLGWHVHKVRKADTTFRIQSEKTAAEIEQFTAQRLVLDDFFSRPENAKLHDRAAFVNTIVDARSFNWTRMFTSLEKVLPEGVRVLNIEPKQGTGQVAVKMTVSAASEDAKLKFLNSLEQSEVFSHLQLTSVRVEKEGAGGGQLILDVTVIYSR